MYFDGTHRCTGVARSCLHLCSFCTENACVQCMCKHRMRTYVMLNNVHKKMTTTLISMNQTGSVELLCIHNYIPVDLAEARLPSPVFCTGVDVLCATLCRPSPTLLTFPKKNKTNSTSVISLHPQLLIDATLEHAYWCK